MSAAPACAGTKGKGDLPPGSGSGTLSSNPSSDLQGSGSLPSLAHTLTLLKQSDYSIDCDAAGAPCLLGEGNFGAVGASGWLGAGWLAG